jgi:dTMP kinase
MVESAKRSHTTHAPRIGLKRTDDRGTAENRYERMDPKFHETLRAAFLDIAKREPDRCAVVDASGSEDEVEQAIRAVLAKRLDVG